ncbi:hypothetical protein UPYG_G00154700 [Umbra pygmaea]|uniref:PDZ domain-containing protein n=1 Tax=Umbra pygmaea TaxID=75934 RepID=A0ABD0WXW1_UMBPY
MATRQLSQNGGLRDVSQGDGREMGGNCNDRGRFAGGRGRAEWRGLNLSNRSKSLDKGGEGTRPDQGYGGLGGTNVKRSDSFESRGAGESRVLSRVKAFNSGQTWRSDFPPGGAVSTEGVGYLAPALAQTGGGLSLPVRLRPSPGIREPASGSIGPSLGQTIWDRIEKLYGSSGPDNAASREEAVKDSTRTKRLSAPVGDWPLTEREDLAGTSRQSNYIMNNLPSQTPLVEQNSTHTHHGYQCLVQVPRLGHSVFPMPQSTRDRPSGKQKQGQAQLSYPEERSLSLDRARSRFTVDDQTRGEDTQTPTNTPAHTLSYNASHTPLGTEKRGREHAAVFLPQHSQSVTHTKETQPITAPVAGVATGSKSHLTKQLNGKLDTCDRTLVRGVAREDSLSDDVFEANTPQSAMSPNSERTKLPRKQTLPVAASVRNKIQQFEALTQKANYRRAFSVPEKLAEDRPCANVPDRSKGVLKGGGQGHGGQKEETGKSLLDQAPSGVRGVGGVQDEAQGRKLESGLGWRSMSVDEVGLWLENRAAGEKVVGCGTVYNPRVKFDILLNGKTSVHSIREFSIDEPDGPKHTAPPKDWSRSGDNTPVATDTSPFQLFNNNISNGWDTDQSRRLCNRDSPSLSSPVSDDDKTPTNTPENSPFYPQNTPNTSPSHNPASLLSPNQGTGSARETWEDLLAPTPSAQGTVTTHPPVLHPGLERDSLSPNRRSLTGVHLTHWYSDEGEESDDDDDTDDEVTEKDESSHYDSDSGESSVTVTSTMSQSDRKSFSLSLAELYNFGGVEYDSQSSSDSDEWFTNRSVSLSSDTSAFSYVSVLGSDELERLLDDVRGLGDSALQNYEDVQVVVLHKELGVGLGFTVAGGVDQNKPVTVHKVIPEGVAAMEGSIHEGVQVLSINGTALSGSTHSEVLKTLKRARSRGMAVVVLKRRGLTDPHQGRTETDSHGQTQTEMTGRRLCVRLEKRSRDLGFSLEGGVGSSLGDRPLTVQKVFLGGPVSDVSPGDEVLEIQGVSLVGLRRLEAWNLIVKLPTGPVDVVLRRPHKPHGSGTRLEVRKACLQPEHLQHESYC